MQVNIWPQNLFNAEMHQQAWKSCQFSMWKSSFEGLYSLHSAYIVMFCTDYAHVKSLLVVDDMYMWSLVIFYGLAVRPSSFMACFYAKGYHILQFCRSQSEPSILSWSWIENLRRTSSV